MHRFLWDLHYQPIPGLAPEGDEGLPIAAVPFNTVPAPTTPWVAPGTYTLKLTANGRTLTQPIVVKPDPRVKTPALAMQQVYTLSRAMWDEAAAAHAAADAARKAGKEADAKALAEAAQALANEMNILQAADIPPTAVQLKAIAAARRGTSAALAKSTLPQKKLTGDREARR
jgi:hypothetical protein